MFSKACEYGIRATLLIASKSLHGERVSLKEIAADIGSPEAFTAKILQDLARNHVVKSLKGPHGGFEMSREDIDNLRLVQIVSAIDGDKMFSGCGLGLSACSEEHPCPVHHKFKVVRDQLETMLRNTSIYEMATGYDIGLTVLRR